jgi:protein-disulfide isomerase
MKASSTKKLLYAGFISGVVLTLLIWGLMHAYRASEQEPIAAEIQGDKLSLQKLRRQVANELVPVENDEYRILKQGAEQWLNSRLIQKEAKAHGISVEELYRKELWSRIQVSYADGVEFYNKHRELFDKPFDQVSSSVLQELRREAYARKKEEYLKELRKKYNAKLHLKKPKSFVEGLALPPAALLKPTGAKTKKVPPQLPVLPEPAPSRKVQFNDLEGRPSLGPKDAPITIVEFSDFHCPFCARATPTMDRLMNNYSGKIRRVWRHYPLAMHPGAARTHEASECAYEQGKFWEYHHKLFATQGGARDDEALTALGKQTGLDEKKFKECLTTGKYRNLIQQEIAKADKIGVNGTPTFFVNGQEVAGAYPYAHFAGLVGGILNPGKAVAAVPPPRLKPPGPSGPVRFEDLEGRPSLGPKNAPVTVVEFSDFHCPFCKRVTPTMEELMKNFPGKIRRVWRHYPLAMHSGSDRTHEASECANEQGKFWEYHAKLFQTQGGPRNDDALLDLARQAGLKEKKFKECLSSGKYKGLIQQEIAKGNQVGVRGTPAFFINGQSVAGAQPYGNFEKIVQSELSKAKS